jgi:hypothetical protein
VTRAGRQEQSLARTLCRRLEEDWLLIADRNFFNWADWCAAADSGGTAVAGQGRSHAAGPGPAA